MIKKGILKQKIRRSKSGRTIPRQLLWGVPLMALLMAAGAWFAHGQNQSSAARTRNECVILLHGLYRTAASMALMEHQLVEKGYDVINIDYSSTRSSITQVAEDEVTAAVSRCVDVGYERIHFVSHSLGALIIRSYLQDRELPEGSRVVMLAPPNQGSELADWAYRKFPRISRMSGPSAVELGTKENNFASRLAPISPEVGIIIGKNSWNPIFSKILPGNDDGAVTVERAKLSEMTDFLVAPCNHTTIILNSDVQQQVIHFLSRGEFDRSDT